MYYARNKVKGVAVPAIDISELGVADANRVLQHGSKHRLQFAGRAADDLKYLGCGSLLLQCFRKVVVARKIIGALTQFVQQPRIFDRDPRLVCKVLD